jgi:hypothetical protein
MLKSFYKPGGISMNVKSILITMLMIVCALPLSANDNKKQKDMMKRGMLEKMEAVPCGAKQRGLSGLGSFWASAGITHVNSDEKLCPQYLLRTDEMNYEIRPFDMKHAILLPVGHEGTFRLGKNSMLLSVEDAPDRKVHAYEIVAMNPTNAPKDEPDAGPPPNSGQDYQHYDDEKSSNNPSDYHDSQSNARNSNDSPSSSDSRQ